MSDTKKPETRKRGQKIVPNEVDKQIGMRIRIARNISGRKQEDLAKYLDLTLQQIQKYENGKNKISVNILSQIAFYFNISISYFIPNNIRIATETTKDLYSLEIMDQKIAENWKPISSENDLRSEEKEIILKIMEIIANIKDFEQHKKILEFLNSLSK